MPPGVCDYIELRIQPVLWIFSSFADFKKLGANDYTSDS